ncbi:MAG: CoA transferase, partial [Chloroflexales bacterium]|nr:CoA transferase [Chloroflexales bacterium]
YGIYATADGYLALAMGSVVRLGELLDCPPLAEYTEPQRWFTERDTIKAALAEHLCERPTAYWLARLEPADYWCADVLTWPQLLAHDAFKALRMTQHVSRANGAGLETTRCPIRIDGALLTSPRGAPKVGEHTDEIAREFEL